MTHAKTYRTTESIRYKTACGDGLMYRLGIDIPKGAPCTPADSGDYWVTDWTDIPWSYQQHAKSYGIRVPGKYVEECPA